MFEPNEGQKRKQIGVFFVTSKMQKALDEAIDHEIARLDYATNVVLNFFFQNFTFPLRYIVPSLEWHLCL